MPPACVPLLLAINTLDMFAGIPTRSIPALPPLFDIIEYEISTLLTSLPA